MRKITALVIVVATMLTQFTAFSYEQTELSEPIELSVKQVERKAMQNSGAQYTMVDLRPYANRAYADEVAGDRIGGWSDQGNINDMRNFKDFGRVKYHDVPFDIIPEGTNNNCAVLGLRGQNDEALPTKVKIPVDDITAGAYILHSAPYGSRNKVCGRYSFVYEDGTSSYLDIVSSLHINDFWGEKDAEYARVAWVGDNTYAKQNNSRIHFTMLALNNPHPEKKVVNFVMETEGTSAYIMVIGVTFTDVGPYLPMESKTLLNPDDSGWRGTEKRDYISSKGTSIDVSFLLDAPAGKHGAVTVKGDKFVFADGTEAKFWGTNIVGKSCFPEKEEAELLAEALAQNGINIVRMSEMDGDFEGSIFKDESSTLELSNEQMDKLCYLIYCLKEKGIYTYLTITSQRTVKEDDGVDEPEDTSDGYKVEAYFDEKLIDLQKKYISKLLSWKNDYTGFTLAKDPAVCMVEFLDANGLFDMSSRGESDWGIGSEKYQNEIDSKYNSYVKKKYSNTQALKKAWKKEYDFTDGKTLGNLSFFAGWKDSLFSVKHKEDVSEFLIDLSQKYYTEMKKYINSIGFVGVTTVASNKVNAFSYGDIFASGNSDFVARSAVNSYTISSKEETGIVFDKGLGYADDLLKSRIGGKPFVVTAWGTSFASPFSGDSVMLMSVLSAQQGWSACQYAFLNGKGVSEDKTTDTISISNDTTRLGLMPAAAILYYSMDELDSTYTKKIGMKDTVGEESFENVVYQHLFDRKVGATLADKTSIEANDPKTYKNKNKNFVFDYEENIYGIRNSQTEAFVGALDVKEELEHIDIYVDNAMCAVVLSCLDGKTFDNANRFLLTTVGRTRNKGMLADRWKQVTGGAESVTEPVTGTFVLKNGKCRVYSLDFSGNRKKEIPTVTDRNGNVSFNVSVEDSSVYYEIVKE